MKKMSIFAVSLGLLSLGACKSGVEDEMQDLKEARQNTDQKAQELQQELDQAKARVVELEEKVALARQGVTDDVLEEREDLKQALKEREQDVEQEVQQAQKEAAEYNQKAVNARDSLDKTVPANVEASVETNTQVLPGEKEKIEGHATEETIRVQQNELDLEKEKEAEEPTQVAPQPQS